VRKKTPANQNEAPKLKQAMRNAEQNNGARRTSKKREREEATHVRLTVSVLLLYRLLLDDL
jgi:hypothetical protein